MKRALDHEQVLASSFSYVYMFVFIQFSLSNFPYLNISIVLFSIFVSFPIFGNLSYLQHLYHILRFENGLPLPVILIFP
jgi:hypothetical protein